MPRRSSALLAALAMLLLGASSAAALLPDPVVPVQASAVRAPAPAPAADTDDDPQAAQQLAQRVAQALSGSTARTVSAAVEVEGLGTVYRRDAAHARPPASTQKSFVALAALLAVPAGERYRTTLSAAQEPVAGVVRGPLWVYGSGDPYLTDAGLKAMAADLRAKGVTTVTGDLLLDDSRYDAKRRADGWKSSWVPEQSGPLSSFAVDRNARRTDSAYLTDPALPNAVALRNHIRAAGIRIGTVKRNRVPAGAVVVTERVSGPVEAVVRRMMKDSDNFAAELVLKELGRRLRDSGTSVDGLASVRQLLGDEGVPVGAGADGSGLSRYDRPTTDGELRLLSVGDASPVRAAFRASMPIACRDGTLKTRFCGTAAEGRLSAKTGTLDGVRALAGYTKTRSGRVVRFSFILTSFTSSTQARAAMDRAAVVLASAPE